MVPSRGSVTLNSVLLVNLGGFALIATIIWWFWLSSPKAVRAQQSVIEIRVANGVYTPSRIVAQVGSPITVRFFREDPSPCAEKVIFDELGVTADLSIQQPIDVTITPAEAGEYTFTCQMQMYRGTLLVKDYGADGQVKA